MFAAVFGLLVLVVIGFALDAYVNRPSRFWPLTSQLPVWTQLATVESGS